MRRLILAAAVLSLAAAGQASAHARLLKSDPAKGATVAAPAALKLSFSEGVVPAQSSVALTGPGGKAAAIGPMALAKNNKVVIVPVSGNLAAGAYKVDWKMTSEDGHTMTGTFGFKVK